MTPIKAGQRLAAPPARTTRERIVAAAIDRFSRHSYEETGLRDIAADVGVDVAYVHRCFGSKERLFAAALETSVKPSRFVAENADELAEMLVDQVFDAGPGRRTIGPLDIVIRSLSSPEASHVVREFIAKDFIDPIVNKTRILTNQQVAVVAAFLAGLGILRNVLRVAPLLDGRGGELERLVADTLRTMLERGHRTSATVTDRA